MDAQASRKLIIAGVMAVVVGVGVTTFAMRAHTVARAPQALTPPADLGASPASADVVAPTAEAPMAADPATPTSELPAAPPSGT